MSDRGMRRVVSFTPDMTERLAVRIEQDGTRVDKMIGGWALWDDGDVEPVIVSHGQLEHISDLVKNEEWKLVDGPGHE